MPIRKLLRALSCATLLALSASAYPIAPGITVTVSRNESGLSVTVPGQPTYVLEPSRETEFSLVGLEEYSLRFVVEEGQVTRAVFIQPNGVFAAIRK